MALEEGQEQEDSGVAWDAASDFFNGKEAAGEQPAADAPSEDGTVDVRIKGKTVKMSKEAADAYTEFVRETRERDGRLGGEIAQLRERSARLEGMIETVNRSGKPESADDSDIKPPPAALAIENFGEWQRQFLAYHGAMMLRQQAELEGKYTSDVQQRSQQAAADAAQRAWADRFYAQNPHLNKPHLRDIVTSVYQRNAKELNDLNATNIADAHDRLAELADAEIVAIKSDGKKIESANTNRPPRLEGAGSPGAKGKQRDTFVPASSASWSARKRAALRGEVKK